MTSKRSFMAILVIVFCAAFIAGNYSDILTKENSSQLMYTGKEDHNISLEEASEMTRAFREQAGPDAVIGGYFGRDALLTILTQDGAVGMRFYYALNEEGIPHIVLVGVGAQGNDMTEGMIAERNNNCPPWCSEENELNSTQTLYSLGEF